MIQILEEKTDRGGKLVASFDGAECGRLIYLTPDATTAEIVTLNVDKAFRGQGVGTALAQHMRDMGFETIKANYSPNGEKMLNKFWAENGGPLADMQPLKFGAKS